MPCESLLAALLLATAPANGPAPASGFEPTPPPSLALELPLAASDAGDAALRQLLAHTDLRLRALDERTNPGRLLGLTLLGVTASAAVGAVLGLVAGLPAYASGAKALLDSLLVSMATGAALSAAVGLVVGIVRLIADLRTASWERSSLLEERADLQRRLESRGRPPAGDLAPATPVFVARF